MGKHSQTKAQKKKSILINLVFLLASFIVIFGFTIAIWIRGQQEESIIENRPTVGELKQWVEKSGLPLKKFFNTSGLVYKSLNLKEKLPSMSEEEQYTLLATDGKLVKRPIAVHKDLILVGFNQDQWEKLKG